MKVGGIPVGGMVTLIKVSAHADDLLKCGGKNSNHAARIMGMRILIVDSDAARRQTVEIQIQRMGLRTLVANSAESALAFLRDRRDIALVLLDSALVDISGVPLIQKIKQIGNMLPVIALERDYNSERISEALRLGAIDFVTSPVIPERLQISVTNALKMDALAADVRKAGAVSTFKFCLDDVVTRSPVMARLLGRARRLALAKEPILIQGERGSGKEMLARAIVGSTHDRANPFFVINCRLFDMSKEGAQLFAGQVDGQYAGFSEAYSASEFNVASSTILLDRVWALPFAVQERLYELLKTQQNERKRGAYLPVGNQRIIATTSRSLDELVAAGRFHAGLNEILSQRQLNLPSLRERREDIPHLLQHFVMRYASEERYNHVRGIKPFTMKRLSAYDWPGNVHELRSAAYRAVIMGSSSELDCADFAHLNLSETERSKSNTDGRFCQYLEKCNSTAMFGDVRKGSTRGILKAIDESGEVRTIASAEEEMIRLALVWYSGQISEVARRLGIGRTTLYRKMKEYGIDVMPDADQATSPNFSKVVKVAI